MSRVIQDIVDIIVGNIKHMHPGIFRRKQKNMLVDGGCACGGDFDDGDDCNGDGDGMVMGMMVEIDIPKAKTALAAIAIRVTMKVTTMCGSDEKLTESFKAVLTASTKEKAESRPRGWAWDEMGVQIGMEVGMAMAMAMTMAGSGDERRRIT